MKGRWLASALTVCLLFATVLFAQEGINASLSGTVSDPTGALIPGVEVTAKNTGTGVAATAITNETGTYRFPSLQPGSYETTAVLTGFSTQTVRLTLGMSQQIRQNFSLAVGTVAQAVEVTRLRRRPGIGRLPARFGWNTRNQGRRNTRSTKGTCASCASCGSFPVSY